MKQNKRMHIESEIWKDISTQGDQPETGCVGSSALSKEILKVEGTFLFGCVVAHGLPFPTEA